MCVTHSLATRIRLTPSRVTSSAFVQVVTFAEGSQLRDPEDLTLVEKFGLAFFENAQREVFFSVHMHGTVQVMTVTATRLVFMQSEASPRLLYGLPDVHLPVELVRDAVDVRHEPN